MTRRWCCSARTTSGRSPSRPRRQSRLPVHRARGCGFPGIRVDGNDVLACLAVTRWALDECRHGNGPVLIEAFTYRMNPHTTSDDPTRYRLGDDVETWKLKDPIERVRVHLTRNGLADQAFFDGSRPRRTIWPPPAGVRHQPAGSATGPDIQQRVAPSAAAGRPARRVPRLPRRFRGEEH